MKLSNFKVELLFIQNIIPFSIGTNLTAISLWPASVVQIWKTFAK